MKKKLTAYHEGGTCFSFHLICQAMIQSIKLQLFQGVELWVMVMNLPERDKHGYSIKYLKARMAVCFGGQSCGRINIW
jgi:cell division protease FtsH